MRKFIVIAGVLIQSFLVTGLVVAQVTNVESIGITVKDMNRSLKFYTEVLGFKKTSDEEFRGEDLEKLKGLFGINIRVVRLQLGAEFIELTDYLTTGGRSIPEDQKSNDLSFQHIAIVVSDMDKAYEHLKKFGVEHVSTAPQTLPKSIPAAEGIRAFYFHDPDNHNLELIYFPRGKGQVKWQQQPAAGKNNLFLGIDHTAIGVSNSENSHHFYTGILGIERKGDSWNKGIEQSHLNNVEGASLHITGYRAANGPGIEFLEYIVPGPGKLYPADSRPDDIWHWHTTIIVDDAERLFNLFMEMKANFVSTGVINLQIGGKHFKSFIVRDPDGHAICVKQLVKS